MSAVFQNYTHVSVGVLAVDERRPREHQRVFFQCADATELEHRAVRMRAEGWSYRRISERLGVRYPVVRGWLSGTASNRC